MAEIRFKEGEDLLCQDLAEDKGDFCEGSCEGEEHLQKEKIKAALGIPDALADEATEIIIGLSESMNEETSVAFAYLDEVLYARIYDGEKYVFPLPFMLSERADATGACVNLAAYTTKYMLPLIITDVPREELEFLCSVFPHVDAYTYDEDDDSFFIKVNNECDMLDSVPSIELDGITLDELTDADRDVYASLCSDRELNKYWGYDVDVDNPEMDADFYLDVARSEIEEGIAIALAIRESGAFVGEATVYGFDYRGSASIAVRVLPAYHSRGIGSRATRALIELARGMDLKRLVAEIYEQNDSSVRMTSKYMDIEKRENGKVYFTLTL